MGIQCFYKINITFQVRTVTQYIHFLRIVFFYQFFIWKMYIYKATTGMEDNNR